MGDDSVAQDQIRAFVERIMRLREEAKAINGDIREVYAEAKGNGFDKTVLGKLVSYVEKRATGAADLQEAEALFDLYLSAYDGATGVVVPRAHVHAREVDENGDGPIRRMTKARQEIFDALEADGVIPGRDTGRSVYFLLAESAGLLKIGSSDDVRVRVRGLAGASPVKLQLIGVVSGGTARELELHKQFHARRVHGEWFTVDDEFLAEIQDIVATHTHETAGELVAPGMEAADHGNVVTSGAAAPQAANPGGENVAPPPAHAPEQPGTDVSSVSPPAEGGAHSASIPIATAADPAGANDDRGGEGAPSSHAATVVTLQSRTHNPETHFLSNDGLLRLHGCQKPELCASGQPRLKLCFSCSVAHDGPTHGEVA